LTDLLLTLQNSVVGVTDTTSVFPDIHWVGDPVDKSFFIFSFVLGAAICFIYIALNKYDSIKRIEKEPINGSNETRKIFKDLGFIWYSKWRSLVFKNCLMSGSVGALLFVLWVLLDLTIFGNPTIPFSSKINTGSVIVDFAIVGLAFAFFVYPILTANIISIFSFGFLQDLFFKMSDRAIIDDIENSKLDWLRSNIKSQGTEFNVKTFKSMLYTWTDLAQTKIEDETAVIAFDNAVNKYEELLFIMKSVMKSIGDDNMKSLMNYRLN